MEYEKILPVILIIVPVLWFSSFLYGDIPNREKEALRSLYESTGGNNWSNSDNWLKGESVPVHTWYGITCNPENTSVTGIKLEDNKLKGDLSLRLGNLSNLEIFILGGNQLVRLHPSLGKLSKLRVLNISGNPLSGPDPKWIGNLSNLEELNLSDTGLSGNFPHWIEQLSNLKVLNLSNNRLNGKIPTWIDKLKNLEHLLLDANQLTGNIPTEIGNLKNLKVLRIGHNRLSGNVPDSIVNLELDDDNSNFKWNALFTAKATVKKFLREKQSGEKWQTTQTVKPQRVRAVPHSQSSIKITWRPIAYTADSGGYRVFYSTSGNTPPHQFKEYGKTNDKRTSQLTVKRLKASTEYHFAVRSWTDKHGSNGNRVESGFSKKVSAATLGTTISGSVTTAGRSGVLGVKIIASNNGGKTSTDDKGNYKLNVPPGWSGTITLSKNGYSFKRLGDTKENYFTIQKDLSGEDYEANAITVISGKVTLAQKKGVDGVTLTFSCINKSKKDEKATWHTNSIAGGYYSYTVPYNWKCTVTPSKTGYTFVPPHKEYKTGISAKQVQNFNAVLPVISGRVENRWGKGIEGVKMTFSNAGGTVKTEAQGDFHHQVLNTWSGKVTPSKDGYVFIPSSIDCGKVIADKEMEFFTAVKNVKFFLSLTGNYMLPAAGSFKDIYGSGIIDVEVKGGYTFYRNLYGWVGYGMSAKTGESRVFKEPAKWKESFLSLGLGYTGHLSLSFDWKAEVGISYVDFSEKAFNDQATTTAIGFRSGAAVIYKLYNWFFMALSLDYLFASGSIDDFSLKLGGAKAGFGLGLRF